MRRKHPLRRDSQRVRMVDHTFFKLPKNVSQSARVGWNQMSPQVELLPVERNGLSPVFRRETSIFLPKTTWDTYEVRIHILPIPHKASNSKVQQTRWSRHILIHPQCRGATMTHALLPTGTKLYCTQLVRSEAIGQSTIQNLFASTYIDSNNTVTKTHLGWA